MKQKFSKIITNLFAMLFERMIKFNVKLLVFFYV